MIDPLTASVMIVLGKYAIDKGGELVEEYGPAAAQKAGELFKTALDYLRGRPQSENVATEFEQDPETYQKPMEKKLDEAVQADPAFAGQLKELLAAFETAVSAAGPHYTAALHGSGAISQGSGTALGQGAVQARDVQGSIITGSQNVIYTGRPSASSAALPPNLVPLHNKLVTYFSKSELEALCFRLGLPADDLPGETRTELAQALIEYCHRRDRLPELVNRCQAERPQVDWGSV